MEVLAFGFDKRQQIMTFIIQYLNGGKRHTGFILKQYDYIETRAHLKGGSAADTSADH